jgi:hypothetical protein
MTTTRIGRMDVRLPASEPGSGDGRAELRQISEYIAAELAKTDERLIRLLGEHWTGFAEGPMSPWMVYKNVGFEAETCD